MRDGEAGGPRPAGQGPRVDQYFCTCSEAEPRILQVNVSARIRLVVSSTLPQSSSYSLTTCVIVCHCRGKQYEQGHGERSTKPREVMKDGLKCFVEGTAGPLSCIQLAWQERP